MEEMIYNAAIWSDWKSGEWLTLIGLLLAAGAIGATISVYYKEKANSRTALRDQQQMDALREVIQALDDAKAVAGAVRVHQLATREDLAQIDFGQVVKRIDACSSDIRLHEDDRRSLHSALTAVAVTIDGLRYCYIPDAEELRYALSESNAGEQAKKMQSIIVKSLREANKQWRELQRFEQWEKSARGIAESAVARMRR